MTLRRLAKRAAKKLRSRSPFLRRIDAAVRALGRRRALKTARWSAIYEHLAQHGRPYYAAEALGKTLPSSKRDRSSILRRIGDLKLDGGQLDEGMRAYRKALHATDFDPNYVVLITHHLVVAGFPDEAVGIFAEASRRDRARSTKRFTVGEWELQVLPHYWVDRIGHLAFLDSLIKMMLMGWSPPRPVILLAPEHLVANRAYLDYWRKYLDVESDAKAVASLAPLVHIVEDNYFTAYRAPSGAECWWIKAAWAAQQEWDREGRSPLLRLTQDHERRGWQSLKSLGVRRGDWFVCLHVRESGYHAAKKDPPQEWRDSDIARFDLAINAITARGGWVIRMGDAGMRPMPPGDRVIDYAHSAMKSDWMDVFLSASCRFFIATNSGLGIVPATFGVPCVAVDYIPLANELYIKNGCFIPKLCWSAADGRYLTFDECMQPPLGYTHRGETFAGLTMRNNTPDEISEIVTEMMDRLDGTFVTRLEDEQLQSRFNRVREKNGVVSNAPIGCAFLRRHAELLVEVGPEPRSVARPDLVASFRTPENTPQHTLVRGKAFKEFGSWGLAIASFQEVLRLEPENIEARTLLRDTHFELARNVVFDQSNGPA